MLLTFENLDLGNVKRINLVRMRVCVCVVCAGGHLNCIMCMCMHCAAHHYVKALKPDSYRICITSSRTFQFPADNSASFTLTQSECQFFKFLFAKIAF